MLKSSGRIQTWWNTWKYVLESNNTFTVVLFLFLLCVTLVLGIRTFFLFQTLVDADLTKRLENLNTQLISLETDISLQQQKLLEQKHTYDMLLSSVLPSSLSSGYVAQILDKIVLAVSQDITLTGMVNQEDKIEKNGPYSIYPVEATFMLSKDALDKLLTLLSHAGSLDENVNKITLPTGESMMLPLITLEHITIEGDMGDQYDASGNKLKNQITAKLLLHFYRPSS
jgi:hypothetical protein